MKSKAIILGGTNDHIYLIKILKEKGFYCILIDYLDNPSAKIYADEFIQESILDKEKVLEIAAKKNVNLVIATCIDQALVTSAFVSEKLGLPCHITYQTALNLTNKMLMKKIMKEHDIPTSEFSILRSIEEVKLLDKCHFPMVIKPVDANSSKGVYKVFSTKEIDEQYNSTVAFSSSGLVIVEEFIEGIELSVDVFIQYSKPTILMVTENVKAKSNTTSFTITESVYNSKIETETSPKLEKIASNIASAFGIQNGPLLIQCIYDKISEKISVIEFSSRIGGGSKYFYIQQIKGFDILSKFVDTVLFKEVIIESIIPKVNVAKIKYLYTKEGEIREYVNFETLKQENCITEYFIYKEPRSYVKESSKSTDRCAGIFLTANNETELELKEQKCHTILKVLDNNYHNLLKII